MPPTRLEKLPGPRDIAAATELVDHALDRLKASATYRKLHRDRMIHDEIRFQRFAREMRERRHPAILEDAA